jgi:CheY-like chemotaxis protein
MATLPHDPRVLVVEDQADLRDSLVLLLSVFGCQARAAADGLEGLRLALQWRPDVVISDIGLPGLDGWRLCRLLREAMGNSVLLVALTGYGLPADHKRSREAGFDAHLNKPADPPVLLRLLGKSA